jgi:hypothetical protein
LQKNGRIQFVLRELLSELFILIIWNLFELRLACPSSTSITDHGIHSMIVGDDRFYRGLIVKYENQMINVNWY